jgi:SAM-dependent methyltransferase
MFDRLFHRLLRIDYLRHAQWFFKTEPSHFSPLTPGAQLPNRPACPACAAPASHDSDYPSRHKPFADRRVLYCSQCGLGFVMDMAQVLEQYYKHEYAHSNRGDREVDPAQYFSDSTAGNSPIPVKYKSRVKRQISLLKEHGAAFGRVLDYGSGPGYFLRACQAQEAHAVEPDRLSHKYLAYLGATVHTDTSTLPGSGFDAIVASHVIEHLPAEELLPTLEVLIGALAPQGRLLIEVPQSGHSYLHLSGQRQDPHTLFFTGQALAEAVQAAGGHILFQRAVGQLKSPLRENPVYTPKGPHFYKTQQGSLTLICSAA